MIAARVLLLLISAANVASFTMPKTRVAASSRPSASSSTTIHKQYSTSTDVELDEVQSTSSSDEPSNATRRTILQSALLAPIAMASQPSFASDKPPPIVPLVTTAKRLRSVPLFTIVDGDGVPFHTYDKDSAGGFGYFFTSYTSATYVLDDAKAAFAKAVTDAEKNKETSEGAIGEDGTGEVPDAWGKAQIVTLPLDVVMQLSVKKTSSVAVNGKGKTFSTYYQVIPSTEDLNAALRIENGPRYSERGRVPLFYVDGLTIPSPDGSGDVADPVYFRIKDLTAEWTKQNPGKDIPQIKVRELTETFRAMIRPDGKDTSVLNLVFVPIAESVDKAKSSPRSYKLGEMILTK
ncbi:predicted protein [Thalassiosira pseudonana CCMP1335]|uniref:Uncharacterized protein n=1 Tax=Thalassiosira pseudonana TaxID=35128 RepID=B8BRQ4_THAPS|nr:predicted protein [Thalassiosira pseudonana CCMP1335]EED96580.1 predicted protein [Thalassiosira pseudonana CCMP1335]|eukprot:scaffold456_cov197-Alexandrium_tamarense.AAC.12